MNVRNVLSVVSGLTLLSCLLGATLASPVIILGRGLAFWIRVENLLVGRLLCIWRVLHLITVLEVVPRLAALRLTMAQSLLPVGVVVPPWVTPRVTRCPVVPSNFGPRLVVGVRAWGSGWCTSPTFLKLMVL